MAQGPLRRPGQSELALDHFLLERNHFRLEPDSDPDTIRQSRIVAGLEAIRQRYLAQLSKNQLDVIRADSDPKQFITTNTMGW